MHFLRAWILVECMFVGGALWSGDPLLPCVRTQRHEAGDIEDIAQQAVVKKKTYFVKDRTAPARVCRV